jgi:Flp pilus assembly protein TadB
MWVFVTISAVVVGRKRSHEWRSVGVGAFIVVVERRRSHERRSVSVVSAFIVVVVAVVVVVVAVVVVAVVVVVVVAVVVVVVVSIYVILLKKFSEFQNDLQLRGSEFDSVVKLTNVFVEEAGTKSEVNELLPALHVPPHCRRLLRGFEGPL